MAIKVENLKLISLEPWQFWAFLDLKLDFVFLMNNTCINQGTSKITLKTGLGLTIRFPDVH